MKAKHTPGPWEVADFISNDKTRHLAVWKDEAITICLISPKETENDQDIANARLIAAAPDMLEELKRIRAELIESTRHFKLHSENYDNLMNNAERIFSVIKKATLTL